MTLDVDPHALNGLNAWARIDAESPLLATDIARFAPEIVDNPRSVNDARIIDDDAARLDGVTEVMGIDKDEGCWGQNGSARSAGGPTYVIGAFAPDDPCGSPF